MDATLGKALESFDSALNRFHAALESDPVLLNHAFAGPTDWRELLAYKLVPHLGGEGCLIAAISGGTNTGKSTLFNVLLNRMVSPVVATAAATRRPVLAAGAARAAQCLEGKLLPEFQSLPLRVAELAVAKDTPNDALYIAVVEDLPDYLVLLDTPDVDSIEKDHWEVADHIRAAGDVVVAVLTGEKYRDERVVGFFRDAAKSGRIIVPIMNKANPENDYAVARKQLDEFANDVSYDGPTFALAHDFELARDFTRPVFNLAGGPPLREYLETLDVRAIKERVFRDTVDHFAAEAFHFLERLDTLRDDLRITADEFEGRAREFARSYEPAPGAAMGGLFHEFVQSKRGPLRRAIGAGSKAVVQTANSVGKAVAGALLNRTRLEREAAVSDTELFDHHANQIARITRDLATSYVSMSRALGEPACRLIENQLSHEEIDAIVDGVIQDTLSGDSISEEFRRHAYRTLDAWWNDKKGRRRVLEALDAILAVVPTAIAAPLSLYTGGIGVAETVAFAGPVVEQFVVRVIEYQFGDAMFDFLSPWRKEQRARLENALRRRLAGPWLDGLHRAIEVFESDMVDEMRQWHRGIVSVSSSGAVAATIPDTQQ